MPEYFSVSKAAQRLGCNPGTIRRQCITGKIIGAKKVAYKWRVPMATVEAIASQSIINHKPEELFSPLGKTFGDRMRNLRKNKGLKQVEMGKLIGYKTNIQVSRMELNKLFPNFRVLIKIGEVLKVDLHQLVMGVPPPERERWESGYYQALKTIAEYSQSQIVVDVAPKKEPND
jgi:transcriptional regulator with XRE-family HTH domain